ncbi:alpha-L-fucosidase [bacterium]|nr:alpha-L-fucosidase [bacterium]
MHLNSDRGTLLYGTKASSESGDISFQNGRFLSWKGNAALSWEVAVHGDEQFDLYMIANVRKDGNGNRINLGWGEKDTYHYELQKTSGPYPRGKNFERIKIASNLAFAKGNRTITLSTEGVSSENVLFDFRSLELLPVSAKFAIRVENERAVDSRANVNWMVNAGYGVMFHWTSQSVQADGSLRSFEDAVNAFDVDRFARMVEKTGAGYVMFTIGHAESFCPAPIKSWEACHPGQTTQRDLIDDIAEALMERGIPLICYINGPLGFVFDTKKKPSAAEKKTFVNNFKSILQEMGNRYKSKIAGYWFDSWYQIFEAYPNVPFEEFFQATKIGNKDRIICLNSWIYPAVTPWQDYWAGEVASPIEIPKNGYMQAGPVPDLPYQALLIMEPYWVQKKAEMPEPRFDSMRLSKYIRDCMENGGAVTINLGIYQDGTVGEKALQVMNEVKRHIRNK